MGSVQQLITIPFEEAFNTLKAAKSPKKLYFLMGSDHYLQKFFIDKVYDKVSIENSVQKKSKREQLINNLYCQNCARLGIEVIFQ